VSLQDTDVDAALPVDFPGLMPRGQVSNHTNMIALITLTLKLGETANEMYVKPNSGGESRLTILQDPTSESLARINNRIALKGY
jgi:hypothetical protein